MINESHSCKFMQKKTLGNSKMKILKGFKKWKKDDLKFFSYNRNPK